MSLQYFTINYRYLNKVLKTIIKQDMLLYKEETGQILRACMNVFNELGNGFLEAVYQEALEIEFRQMGIPYQREAKISVFYKGKKLDKEYYADFICFNKIIVELKCVSRIVNANKAQVINYLHGTKMQVGLLVNFGEASLKWERLTNFTGEIRLS